MLQQTLYRAENKQNHPKLFRTLLQMLIVLNKAKSKTILKMIKSILELLKLRNKSLEKTERTFQKNIINNLQLSIVQESNKINKISISQS